MNKIPYYILPIYLLWVMMCWIVFAVAIVVLLILYIPLWRKRTASFRYRFKNWLDLPLRVIDDSGHRFSVWNKRG